MESWSYVSGNKKFLSDESLSGCTDGEIASGKTGLMGLAFSSSTVMCSGREGIIKDQGFHGSGSSDAMIINYMANDSIGDILSSKFGSGRVHNQHPALPNSASREEESSSKLSSSIVESNSQDSLLIDLKLGRFLDHKNCQIKANHPNSSRADSSMPVKKARAGNLSSQRPFCQVYGCRKDLSSSKDYHKRHKVCEIHSKTAKVIVNGIEQRFCQQCSRFHLLAEFDDGKRSCRKRLAGHNERRRKPHIGMQTSRAGRVYHSCNGARFEGTSFALSSFVCQDILPGSHLHRPRYESNNLYGNVKVEDGASYGPEIATPNTKGQTHSTSQMSSFGSEKQNSPLPDDELYAMMRNKTSERNNSLLETMATSDLDPHSLFHSTTIGSEDLTVLDSSSAVQGLPAVSGSGCALSLLSSHSQNSLNQSGIPTALPLITDSSQDHSMMHISEKLMRVSQQTSTTAVTNTFHTSGVSSAEVQMKPILVPDNVDNVNYGMSRIICDSGSMNAKSHLPCRDGSTINLLQLSSQLQRVERERQSMQVKEETDDLFGLRIT